MPLKDARMALTGEPSGEIRLRLDLPSGGGKRPSAGRVAGSKAAGCGALVYKHEVRDCNVKRSGFGGLPIETKFGRFARRAVKNAVGALETHFGRRVVFLTLTLPGSSNRAREHFARWSAKVIELLTHWIRSTASGAHYVYVWERHKSGALHLHAAIGDSDVLKLRALERNFKTYVHRMFSTVSALAGCDMFERGDGGSWRGCVSVLRSRIEPIRKSVKRYMAKYLTKGAGAAQGYCPSRWWGCSRNLRALVFSLRRCIRRRTGDWELAVELKKRAQELVERSKCKSFSFSLPFSPSSGSLLVYPSDAEYDSVWSVLVDLISQACPVENTAIEPDHDGFPVLRFFQRE